MQICHKYLPWQKSVAETCWKISFFMFITDFRSYFVRFLPKLKSQEWEEPWVAPSVSLSLPSAVTLLTQVTLLKKENRSEAGKRDKWKWLKAVQRLHFSPTPQHSNLHSSLWRQSELRQKETTAYLANNLTIFSGHPFSVIRQPLSFDNKRKVVLIILTSQIARLCWI